ncbi:MAG: YHS domain-containing protein [Candidatus Dormiibacterota bacterium]
MGTPSLPTQIDPVCGMPVAASSSVPAAEFQGREFRFCSPQCRDRFLAAPERFGQDLPTAATGAGPAEIDPVCGMEVDPTVAAAEARYQGRTFYFCSATCHDRFGQSPDRFSTMHSLDLPQTRPDFPIDPICGMSVDPASPGATLELPEGTMYFCCQPCADEYAAAGTASL